MRLAVVEDDSVDLNETLAALERFAKENSLVFETTAFSAAEEFLESQESFDIGLFDIGLPDLTGMELAYKIRESNQNMSIIFLTRMAKYAIEGYSVNASGYVLKPVNYFNLSLSLKRAIRSFEISNRSASSPIVKAGGRSFPLHSVFFCEVKDHTTFFHLENEQISCRCPLSEIEKMGAGQFAKSHASFLVNLAKVSIVAAADVALSNGEKVPLSRTKKKEFMSAMAVFVGRVE